MQRILALAIAGVIIFEGHPGSLVPMALAVTLASLVAVPRATAGIGIRPFRLLRFLPYFLLVSARGGLDVAVRAFRGSGALNPGFIDYPVTLRGELAVLFANVVSLLPGTLTARVEEGRMTVHVLDTRSDVAGRLGELERRVGRAFGATR